MIEMNETQMLKIVILVLVIVLVAVIYDAYSKLRNKELEYKAQIENLEEDIFNLEIDNDKLIDILINNEGGNDEDIDVERFDDNDESKC